jgi:hypothetical protein
MQSDNRNNSSVGFIIVLIGFVASIITIYVFLTGRENISQIFKSSSANSLTPKCEWLLSNFPQTQEGVARLIGVPSERIRLSYYGACTGYTIVDGGIVLGPPDGFNDLITVSVPIKGCIDAYPGATFTGETHQWSDSGLRAYSGTVKAHSLSYWPWCDERRP